MAAKNATAMAATETVIERGIASGDMEDVTTDATSQKQVEEGVVVVPDDHDDEEVELFSTTPSPPSSNVSTMVASLSAISMAPRRCVSRELLEQMPALSISTRYHEVSIAKPFGVFHLMQLIEKSIQVGALFTPKLYVPREIWQQDRVKLAGVSIKVEVFQALKQGLEKITVALPPTSPEAKAAFVKEFDTFMELASAVRAQTMRSFPFLAVDKAVAPIPPSPTKSDQPSSAAAAPPVPVPVNAANAAAAGIGKLTNLAFGFGRMVKKQAIAAVERVGAAPTVSTSFDDLEEYAATLCAFFNSTRNLEHLIGLRAGADGGQEEVNEVTTLPKMDDDVTERLKTLAIFLDEVVVEMVMRDIHTLLDTYLRRVTQQFGEFTVDPSLMRESQPSSVSA
ncbi:hypothetical protein PINS_up014733 [Pythium insidiosum]|nr:hypothetical protein PINS_up014733 [Pythium insidiosum]